jgi:hypothetical protein
MAQVRKNGPQVAKTVQRVSMGRGQAGLVISHIQFDKDGFPISQEQAVVPIDSTRDDLDEFLEKAARKQWEIYGETSLTSNFKQARVIGDLPADAELTPSGARSYAVELTGEVAEEKEEKRDVVQTRG